MKILLIKYRNIGDVLLSTSLVSNLRYHFKNSTIDFALNKGCEEMLIDNPDINKIIAYDREFFKSLSKLKKTVEEIKLIVSIRKKQYDLIINLTEGERGANIVFFSKAKNKLGFKIRKGILSKINVFDQLGNDSKVQHTVDKDLQFLSLLNKKIISKEISIFWSADIENEINEIIKKNCVDEYVHVHPVSRWMFKCWEDDRMAYVIDYLCFKKKYKVIITGSKVKHEKDRIEKILKLCKSNPLNLTGQLSLKHLACLSSKSKFFLGVDSAPMHIAAATNSSVVSIMGGSEASKWGAWSNSGMNLYSNKGIQTNSDHIIIADDDHSIIYADGVKKCQGMVNITLDSVIEVLDEYY